MRIKTSSTQGYRKQLQRLKDLLENKKFVSEIESIKTLPKKEKNQALIKFAEKYQIEYSHFSPLTRLVLGEKVNVNDVDRLDMCVTNDDWYENLNDDPHAQPIPIKYHTERKVRYANYPISVGISPMASKRDVLDYVKKNWESIREQLDDYGEQQRFRERPKAKRNEFLWKHRKLPIKDLVEKVNEKFPDESLIDADIHKIISLERKRHYET